MESPQTRSPWSPWRSVRWLSRALPDDDRARAVPDSTRALILSGSERRFMSTTHSHEAFGILVEAEAFEDFASRSAGGFSGDFAAAAEQKILDALARRRTAGRSTQTGAVGA